MIKTHTCIRSKSTNNVVAGNHCDTAYCCSPLLDGRLWLRTVAIIIIIYDDSFRLSLRISLVIIGPFIW